MSKKGHRPYDVAMSDELRVAVRERRLNPDGQLLPVKIEMRGDTEIFVYPWDQMKLGDFFYVPLRGRRADALQVRMRQAAARRDWELTIVQWKSGTDHVLRVCLTLLDVSEIKRKAQTFHDAKGIRYGDGKWSNTRKARYRRSKGAPRLSVISGGGSGVAAEAHPTDDRHGGVGYQELVTPNLVEDVSLRPDYDRDAIIRERLKALGIDS